MRFETVQRALRVGGGIATGLTLVTIVQGLQASSRREVAKEGGKMLTLLHKPTVIAGSLGAAVVILGAMWRPLPVRLPRAIDKAATFAGSALFFASIGLFHWGRRTMAEMYDVSTSREVQLFADHKLITSGPFAYVRHPLYVAGIMAYVGAMLLYRTWTVALVSLNSLSLIQRSRREEETLAQEFGEEWAAYTRRVPAWIPKFF